MTGHGGKRAGVGRKKGVAIVPPDQLKRTVAVRLPPASIELLDALAAKHGLGRAEVIVRAIRRLAEQDDWK